MPYLIERYPQERQLSEFTAPPGPAAGIPMPWRRAATAHPAVQSDHALCLRSHPGALGCPGEVRDVGRVENMGIRGQEGRGGYFRVNTYH